MVTFGEYIEKGIEITYCFTSDTALPLQLGIVATVFQLSSTEHLFASINYAHRQVNKL
jgi:hypothetical protein